MLKFLIVEDEITSRKLLERFLSIHGKCDFATNGAEALAAYNLAVENKSPYSLICLDIMMPELTGFEVLKQIRAIEDERRVDLAGRVKVVMTTSLSESQLIMKSFKNGCEAYLIKPLDKDKIEEQLKLLGVI